jgi:hypothetical protein
MHSLILRGRARTRSTETFLFIFLFLQLLFTPDGFRYFSASMFIIYQNTINFDDHLNVNVI